MDLELPPVKVLIVSADVTWGRSLDSVLSPHGFNVTSAASAQDAIALLERERVGLVIIHNDPRERSGLDLCSTLRQRAIIPPSTPIVILMSEPCTAEMQLQALGAGAWDCLGFPLDPEVILLKVFTYTRALASPPSAESAPSSTEPATPPDLPPPIP